MEARDPSVFGELMGTLRPLALTACNAFRIPTQEREDVVQDVALKVFRNWQSFQAQSQLSTWIYAIARNHCLDLLDKLARSPTLSSVVDTCTEDGSVGPLDQRDYERGDPDHMRCIGAVIAELESEPPARVKSVRKIEVIRFWVEMSPTTEELAVFLKTSVAAAKERKRYVWAHLKTLCAKHCGTDECALERGIQA